MEETVSSYAREMHALQILLTIPAVVPWFLLPETFHRHAIKFETVSSFSLSYAIFVRGYMMMDEYERLLCYLLGFMACGSHPASVAPGLIFYVLAVLRAPRLFGANLLTQDLDGHIEWHVYAGYITSDTVVNGLAFVYYPVLVWTFYMVSFTHKVVAIRDGCILGEEAPLTVDVFETSDGDHQSTKTRLWWRYSTHKLIADSPMLARSYKFALACAVSTWLNHMVMVDATVATVRLFDNTACSLQSVLAEYLWAVCGLLTALLALISISRRALAGASWAHRFRQDLPILFIAGAPCCANICLHHIVMASCTSSGPDMYMIYQLASQFVNLFEASCLQAVALLVLARAHPATSLLGSAVCMVVFLQTVVHYRFGMFSLLVAGIWIWLPMVIPNLLNDILLVHSVWTAVRRSQANAASVASFSSRGRTRLDVELAARPLSKPHAVLPLEISVMNNHRCGSQYQSVMLIKNDNT